VGQIVYPFFLNLLVLMVVSLLGAYLAERLRLAGGDLQAVTRRAEQAERLAALGRLTAGLAHEIRNPLGSIVGSIQLLSSAEGLDPEARQLCGIVERETARLNDLVGDMLQLSGPKPPVLMPVHVARTAREVVALAAQSGRGGDVIVRYEGPESDAGPVIQADSGQLRQVVWNLVRNAIQASNPGAVVRVRVREDDGATLLEVRDDGPGISSEARTRLFDAFFTTRSSGMGIGLAVVKRIVDDHGWTIDVESAERRGATFRIRMQDPPASP
jgi:signal transduction histidine kinase